MTPTKTFEIGRHRPSGGVRTGCLRTFDVMEMSIFNNRHGVVPRRQVGAVPGHYGPSQTAGTSDSREEAGMGQSRATSFNLRMIHWNAEGVRNKKLELQVLLKERNIDVCCIQETHLNSSHRFSIRRYETFRRDRKDRPNGGILTLVKNTHAAAEVKLVSSCYLTKIFSQSTFLTRHPTNSCVPKFLSLTQTDGSSWVTSTATSQDGAMMIPVIKEMK